MLIFKGRGYWVPIIAAIAMLFSSQIADYAFALLGLPRDGLWYIIALLIYTGVLTRAWFLLLPPEKIRHLYVKRTDELIVVGERDTFFFVPVTYCAYGFIAIGVLLMGVAIVRDVVL